MPPRDRITTIITRLGAITALLVAISLPIGYALTNLKDLGDSLEFKAKVKAAAINGLIASHPDLWRYAENRLQGLISREPVPLADEFIQVFDDKNHLILQHGQELQGPTLSRSYALYDVDMVVGRIQVSASLASSFLKTVIAAASGLMLGGIVFVVLRVLPLRALREAMYSLVEEKERAETILSSISDAVTTTDSEGQLIRMNLAWLAMIEADNLAQASERSVFEVVAPEYITAYAELHQRVLAGNPTQLRYEMIGLKGRHRWLETRAVPMRDGSRMLDLAVTRDITASKQAEAKLQLASSVFTHAMEGIMITAADGSILDVNTAFTRITGYSRDEVLGHNPSLLASGRHDKSYFATLWHSLTDQGYWSGEIWNRRKNGDVFVSLQTISRVSDPQGEAQHYVALFSDITSLKEHHNRLEHIAHYDALTKLPNRILLGDRLHLAMTQMQRRGLMLAVAYLDLDGFKAINDQHGHKVGDRLLANIAAKMKQALREGDTIARLGGDEFVAILTDLPDSKSCSPILSRLLTAAAEPIQIGPSSLQVSASIGVTYYPQTEEVDADQLLRQADQAMYQAKLIGKNRFQVFDIERDRSLRDHHGSLQLMRNALAKGEFVLYYQPKVNLRLGTLIGAEALIRWQSPNRGLLLPASFLPTTEHHPIAGDLGDWVIHTALDQMERWHTEDLNISISVNLSTYQLQQTDFVEHLRELLASHPGVDPACLELEIMEASAAGDLAQVSQVINACHQIGVTLALDDFGTGYSSLNQLKILAVDQLKIDQSFVRNMLDSPDDLAILKGILGLAAAFRRQVIAEGVETREHCEMLLQLGCELVQGNGIAKPMPARDFLAWSNLWRMGPSWGQLPADHPPPQDEGADIHDSC
ncbi:MAG: EAL domain-containing protein [Candidatus Sumerlaeaceae bacterium]|nr:EAL domain-containing protein [Candidatus Sumerlaeaceae bacterium]